MAKVKKVLTHAGEQYGMSFACPGCGYNHMVHTQHTPGTIVGPRWVFNDSLDKPTFTPSIHVRGIAVGEDGWDPKGVCHSYVTDGQIQYLSDCTHHLAGQTVDLPEIS